MAGSASFARRVREVVEERGLTLAELAERAELAVSLISKLLTDTDASRREPRLEHVLAIARALELAPRELVLGTGAEELLGEWVPRGELDEESKARAAAQTDAALLRTELAGARSEANSLRESVDQLSLQISSLTRQLAQVETDARRTQTTSRIAREAAEAKLAAAIVERDRALALAEQNEQAWSNARSRIMQLQREVADAKGTGWVAALLGAVGGAMLGASAVETASPSVASAPRKRGGRRAR